MPSTPRSADLASVNASARGDQPFASTLPWLLLLGGVIGTVTSFVLTVEKFELVENPAYVPSCSISPVLNCGSVMGTSQASVFGFPNSLLGVSGFSVLAATGAVLLARARPATWYWLSLQAGATVAVMFVHWLIVQSVFSIGTLCPYCMVVWAITVPVFWYVTLHNLAWWLPAHRRPPFVALILRNHSVPLTIWALGLAAVIANRFWWYWSGLL